MSALLNRFGVPLGAGLASALLFLLTVKGTPLAVALAYLAPLPLMIAAFGWGMLGGAIAAAIAGAAVAGFFGLQGALVFLLVVAAPAWALPSFALIPNYSPPWRRNLGEARSRTPIGAIVTLAAVFGALAGLAGLATLIFGYSGYEEGLQALVGELTPAIEDALQGVVTLPDGVTARDIAEEVARLAPLATAALGSLALCANLYAAARSTSLSHRLPRAWPDLPSEFVLSRSFAAVTVLAIGAAVALPQPIDQFAWVFAAPFAAAFALQGFAVLHAMSRGLPLRPLLIVALYFCCAVRAGWTLPLIAVIGFVDSLISLRARAAAARRSKV
ncbi:MAG: DUF2232 domain-containing protein [Bradyrhizobium sp.]|nr:MAG: DUF2232 domain-containing protein [Bradyrhizobium sp.]